MWLKITSAGLHAHQTTGERKKVRMLNQLSFIFGVVTLPYTVLFYLFDLSVLSLVTVPVALTYLAVPAINRAGALLVGRLVFLLNSNAVVFCYSLLLGVDSGMYLAFFSTSCCPMLFHDHSSRASTVLLTLLPAALCMLTLSEPVFLAGLELDVSPRMQATFRWALVGSVFVILWAILGVFMEQSNRAIQRHVEAARDRARREKAELSLRESRALLARVVEASGLVSWSWNLRSHEITLGGAWRSVKQTASCAEVMLVQDWFDRIHEEDRESVQAMMQRHIRGEERGVLDDYRVRVDDNQWCWLRSESTLLDFDEAGAPILLSGTHRDVHDEHILEAQAQQLALHRIMIQEVHHRVKNNLQIVSSLLSFQQARAEHEKVARQFEVTRNRVSAIASIHETLYSSASPEQSVELGILLRGLIRDIRHAYAITSKQLMLTELGESVEIPFEKAGPCALVVNEWVTNAINHAFGDAAIGEIIVEYENVDQRCVEVRVQDNGKGIELTGSRRAGSLGLRLVRRLAAQLGGTVNQVPTDRGTAWSLRFGASA